MHHGYNPFVVRTDADLTTSHLHIEHFVQRGISFEGEGEVHLTDSYIGYGTRGISTDDRDINDVPDGRAVNVSIARTVIRNMSARALYPLVDNLNASARFSHLTLWRNRFGSYTHRGNAGAIVHISDCLIAANASWGIQSGGPHPPTLSHNNLWNAGGNNYTGVVPDDGSISANPLLVSDDDLHPTSNSPLRNAGSDSSDIGALPFDGAATEDLTGTLVADLTLTAAESPWFMIGDLIVPEGITLTIEPGATVRFGPNDQAASGEDRARTELIVFGTLVADGTAEAPIILDAAANLVAGSWYGVRLEPGSVNHIFNHVSLLNAYNPLVVRTDADFSPSHLRVEHFSQRGLSFEGEGRVHLTDSVISHGTRGISTDDRDLNDVPDGRAINVLVERNIRNYGVYPLANNANASVIFDHVTLWRNRFGSYTNRGHIGAIVEIRNSVIAANTSWGINNGGPHPPTLSHNDVWSVGGNNYTGVAPGEVSLSSNPLFVSDERLEPTANSPIRAVGSDGSDLGAYPPPRRSLP